MKPIASATVEAAKKYALRFIAILPNLVCFRQSFAGCRQPFPGRLIHLYLHYYPVHTSFGRKFIIVGRPREWGSHGGAHIHGEDKFIRGTMNRKEERSVGKACDMTCESRWSPDTGQQNAICM